MRRISKAEARLRLVLYLVIAAGVYLTSKVPQPYSDAIGLLVVVATAWRAYIDQSMTMALNGSRTEEKDAPDA